MELFLLSRVRIGKRATVSTLQAGGRLVSRDIGEGHLTAFSEDRHTAPIGDQPTHLIQQHVADTLQDRGIFTQQQIIGDVPRALLEIAVLGVPAA